MLRYRRSLSEPHLSDQILRIVSARLVIFLASYLLLSQRPRVLKHAGAALWLQLKPLMCGGSKTECDVIFVHLSEACVMLCIRDVQQTDHFVFLCP